jgi:adenylate cyclase, class 2
MSDGPNPTVPAHTAGCRSRLRRASWFRPSDWPRSLPAVKLFARQRIRRDRVPRPPHIEVEVRFRLMNEEEALRQLRSVGIRFGKASEQDDQAYGPGDWDYSQSRIGVTFARLRSSGGKHLFTVKRPVTDVRTCIEHECFVSDRKAMHEAIVLMGFRPTVRIVKTRAMASRGDYTFCLDSVHGLGRFLEVECLAGVDDDAELARAEIDAFVREIGLRVERCFDTYDALIHAQHLDGEAVESSPAYASVAV